MKRTVIAAVLVSGMIWAMPLMALNESKWKDAAIKLGEPKNKITEILGKPDTVDTGTEIYGVNDSPDLMMAMTEYRDEKVCVLAEIYKPAVTVQGLVDKLKAEKLELVSEDRDGTVFLAGPKENPYYMVVSPAQGEGVGPTLAKMTLESFESLEKTGAAAAPQPAATVSGK